MIRALTALAFLIRITIADAGERTSKVIHVTDGDTRTILTPDKLRHCICIAGCDATNTDPAAAGFLSVP